MLKWKMFVTKWEGCRMKQLQPVMYFPIICLEGLTKIPKILGQDN